jgi:serine/threonine protein kinase
MKSDSEGGRRARALFGAGDTLPPPMTTSAPSSPRTSVLPLVERESGELVSPQRPRYEALQHLGSGGVGTVELAQDNDIGRRVAVKRLLPEASRPSDVLRFAEEVRTVGMLEHPNITPIHDVGVDDDGQYFFVMKHVEGETLETIIGRLAAGDADAHARYTFEARTRMFLGVLQALAYAHERGVIHRDIKPANLLVDEAGQPRLLDFGIASSFDESDDGAFAMTPIYASPEQHAGGIVTTASDVYQLGALLRALVMPEGAPCETLPRRMRAIVRKELEAIVARATEIDPALRYAAVASLRADVAAVRQRRPASVIGGPAYLVARFFERNAVPSAIACTAIAVLLSLGWISAHRSGAGRDPAQEARPPARLAVDPLRLKAPTCAGE